MRDKPYCNAPWIGLAYESSVGCKPCCEYHDGSPSGSSFRGNHKDYVKSNYLKNFKKMMYEDEIDGGCKVCIDAERIDNFSTRRRLGVYNVDWNSTDNKIIKFDFRAGNKCNLSCRMCHPESSSMREEEEIKFNNASSVFKVEDMSDAYDIDLSKCVELSILGGEPSIDLEVRKWINHVKDFNIHVIVTTNATNASDKWFDSLKQLKKLSIWLSIDATGDANDFQRKGSDWKELKKNIIKYKKEFKNQIRIQITASAINFAMLDIWWEELMELDIPVHSSAVVYPMSYSLKAIPDEYKDDQIKWLENWISKESTIFRQKKEAKEAIKMLQMNRYDKKYNESFKREVKKMDDWRNENINDLDYRFEEILNA